jgi:hypothetical protein
MTIREAVLSGLPFKRPADTRWFTREDIPSLSFQAECLAADDWETLVGTEPRLDRCRCVSADGGGDCDFCRAKATGAPEGGAFV